MIYSAHCNFLNLARLKLCSWYQTGMIYSQLRRRRCLLFTPINTFFRVMEGKKMSLYILWNQYGVFILWKHISTLWSGCPPFWILTVEWSGARSCLFWWRHRFQIASFSPSTLENSVFKKHRFQIAPLWRAFSNGSVFGDRFRR